MTTCLSDSFRALAVAVLAATMAAAPAQAQGFRVADVVQAEVRPGWRTETGTHMAALHLRLADGWMTYWRVPGESGIPPRFDWTGSRNVAGARMHWPRPEVFDNSGVRTLGFAGELVLPIEFALDDPGAPARLTAVVDLGVCETVCIPVTLTVAAVLPAAGAGDPRIDAALADRPEPAAALGLRSAACAVDPVADGVRVTARLDLPRLGGAEVAVFELPDDSIWISRVASGREGGVLTASAEMMAANGLPFALDRSALRITVLGDGRAAELNGCPAG